MTYSMIFTMLFFILIMFIAVKKIVHLTPSIFVNGDGNYSQHVYGEEKHQNNLDVLYKSKAHENGPSNVKAELIYNKKTKLIDVYVKHNLVGCLAQNDSIKFKNKFLKDTTDIIAYCPAIITGGKFENNGKPYHVVLDLHFEQEENVLYDQEPIELNLKDD